MFFSNYLIFSVLIFIENVFASTRSNRAKIFIASDHRGFKFKNDIVDLVQKSLENVCIVDVGPFTEESTDYTLKASEVVQRISEYKLMDSEITSIPIYSENVFGILICMDGIGMDIAGNYFGFPHKIFTANCRTEIDAITAREHNAARILALGSENESMTPELGLIMIKKFLTTNFLGEDDPNTYARHIKRLSNVTNFVDSSLNPSKLKVGNILDESTTVCPAKMVKSYSDSSLSSSCLSHASTYSNLVEKMVEDVREQLSSSWRRAEKLIKPMIELSSPSGPYPCSEPTNKATCLNWRPYRDEVGETRVPSFRTAITAFWDRILGISDHEDSEHSSTHRDPLKKTVPVDTFQKMFIEKVQPFILKNWKLSSASQKLSPSHINRIMFLSLRAKYSEAIDILRSSSGSKQFFGHFTSDASEMKHLEELHLPYIAFMAEEIFYPISSYTDHGYLCYAYLNQRLVLSKDHDRLLYDAHIKFTLAIHRALILLKIADINALSEKVDEENHCSKFYYRTLTIPGGENSFDVDQLKLSLQNTSFSTHPIGAMLVFQTVWCIRLRDSEKLQRVMLVNPADARLSRVSGLSKHPSEFEVLVPAFSEYVISPDPNLLYENNVGWTEMLRAFRDLILPDIFAQEFTDLFSECGGMVNVVLHAEKLTENERSWLRSNSPNFSSTCKCMYSKISDLASRSALTNLFVPEIEDYTSIELMQKFKNMMVKNRIEEKISFWSEIERQFSQSYESSALLKEQILNNYQEDKEKYILEYAAKLCSELWWFAFNFVDDSLQRRKIFSRRVTMLPDYYYTVVFSFGIICPLETQEDENYSLSLSKIAEGTTSLIGIDPEGWIWKLYKGENLCAEPGCPCNKRNNSDGAKHEYEISSIIHMNQTRQDETFVCEHFIEAVFAGEGHFLMINNGFDQVSFLKMKQTKGDTFSQFIKNNSGTPTTAYIDKFKNYMIQGLEILEFLKSKQIVHMDFHESNAIINVNPENGKESIVLIDFGLAECYDTAIHQMNLALLTDKSHLPTVGKGRFPVAPIFTGPLYVHDLQIFAVRIIENGVLGMSSRLNSIFDRRKVILNEFPVFGRYLSFVKDIFESENTGESSFLEKVAMSLLKQSRMVGCDIDPHDKILIDSYSDQLYLNMKNALVLLDRPELYAFFNVWANIYFIDNPEAIGIRSEQDFPTSSSLLAALRIRECEPNELMKLLKFKIETFVKVVEESFGNLRSSYDSLLDVAPDLSEKIIRITSQLINIRRREIKQSSGMIRADPIPRIFVSCQGSYNPPTKAHLFLAHEGRKRALQIYKENHPEDQAMVECNEQNAFGLLSTIATFEVVEKDYPEQCFTVEERQGFLRHLTGTKLNDFLSGDSPYDMYNDWSWLLLDYSSHSLGRVKNSSEFLAESENIELIFLITFIAEGNYTEEIKLKRDELILKYKSNLNDFSRAHKALIDSENTVRPTARLNISSEITRENQLFLNDDHQSLIETIFKEILIDEDRLKTKGNFRLFAISGEPRNMSNKGLYLGMADVCPRDYNAENGASFNVSSTKIRSFLANLSDKDGLKYLEDSVAERINRLDSLFKFAGSFVDEFNSEFASEFFNRSYVDQNSSLKYAKAELSQIPLRNTVFRESYKPLPILVERLTMFMNFEDPDNLESSPFFITGIFTFKWNSVDYPEGHANLKDLLELDGRHEFVDLVDVHVLDSEIDAKYFVTKDKIIFSDHFIRKLIEEGSGTFRMVIKAKVCEIGKNRSGRGLYLSGKDKETNIALSLMEPFGFSHLFFMQDRPDVLALYDLILLNYDKPHTLLSGGEFENIKLSEYLEQHQLEGVIESSEKEVLVISDKHVKPTYLFQCIFLPFENEEELVSNGKMRIIERNGTTIRLVREISGTYDDTSFALISLIKVMEFDEKFSDCSYDSKNLTLVAATDFNSGAREMRNFMIFSPSKLLANPSISTIDDFYNVERIVAHEYLHHVSGNRITMRDFFEVTLKEGLTVLRDMYFREHAGIYGKCSRLEAVTKLRKTQWVQDSGPKAHSVRPDSIEHKGDFEVSLFTTTVYEKGAEIMRMIQEMIEPDIEKFSKFLADNYLSGPIRSSTIEEFVDCFDLESNLPSVWFNKEQFMKWFLVKGTPVVSINWRNLGENCYEIILKQSTTNGFDDQEETEMLIPTRISFFNVRGEELNNYEIIESSGLHYYANKDLFVLNKSEGRAKFHFQANTNTIFPSVNRGFTAPIKLDYQMTYEASFMAKYESDQMSRFDAFQFLIRSAIIEHYNDKNVEASINELADLIRFRLKRITEATEEGIFKLWVISRSTENKEEELLELALSIEEMYLSNLVDEFDSQVDPLKLSDAREFVQKQLSERMFSSSNFESRVFDVELDPFSCPGRVKLDQVMLRTFVNSRDFADRLYESNLNPSMERQIALLECRYRLSNSTEERLNLLSEFNEFIIATSGAHPVAKEKLFKFIILKSATALEMKRLIEKFDLINPTQPQNLKLFAKEFASNNLAVFHSFKGLEYMAEVIGKCDKHGNHETAATLIKHSFEVNLLKLDHAARVRVATQLEEMSANQELSSKLKAAVNGLLKKLKQN